MRSLRSLFLREYYSRLLFCVVFPVPKNVLGIFAESLNVYWPPILKICDKQQDQIVYLKIQSWEVDLQAVYTHTHTHTHIYICIYKIQLTVIELRLKLIQIWHQSEINPLTPARGALSQNRNSWETVPQCFSFPKWGEGRRSKDSFVVYVFF